SRSTILLAYSEEIFPRANQENCRSRHSACCKDRMVSEAPSLQSVPSTLHSLAPSIRDGVESKPLLGSKSMPPFEAVDFYNLEELLTEDERIARDAVRQWVQDRFLPVVAQHYRAGTFPMELVPELAHLGVFGPSIKGYSCGGLGSVAVGLMM